MRHFFLKDFSMIDAVLPVVTEDGNYYVVIVNGATFYLGDEEGQNLVTMIHEKEAATTRKVGVSK